MKSVVTIVRLSAATCLLLLVVCVAPITAQPVDPARHDFEGPTVTWRFAGADAAYRIDKHQRVPGKAQVGTRCEELLIRANNGSYVHFAHDLQPAALIDELQATLWIKADRPGIQVLLRAVLPRSSEPGNSRPLTALIRGESYTTPGRWQQLRVANLPRLLERQAVILRTEFGPNVDTREAYIDQVVLNVYGGPGTTRVEIDDLQLHGFVAQPGKSNGAVRQVDWTPTTPASRTTPTTTSTVELRGSLLQLEGKPFFPRIIEYRGEPLSFLKQLGFNAVRLGHWPSEVLLAEAQREQLFLVCPPPADWIAEAAMPGIRPLAAIDLSRILAWDLGDGLTRRELDRVAAAADALRSNDRRLVRPLTAGIDSDLRSYSRHIDLLRVSRYPLGTTLELSDYGTWLRERPRLARPGTPMWTTVQTQPLTTQPGANSAPGETIPADQIRLLTYSAISAGVRGLCFASQSRLDTQDLATRQRALILELLNLEIDLIDPWCAAGTYLDNVASSDPEVRGAVLQTDRTWLMLPLWIGRGAQCVPGQSAGNGVSLTVPGVREDCDVLEITPAGMKPLKHLRKPGGIKVTLDEFGLTSIVLLTHDPLAITGVSRKLVRIGPRAARLQRELLAVKLAEAEQVGRQLAPLAPAVAGAANWIELAKSGLTRCDKQLAVNDHQAALAEAQRAARPVRLFERAHWDQAIKSSGSPVALSSGRTFTSLPAFWTQLDNLKQAPWGLNQLPAGDFENLDRVSQTGWTHFQLPQPELQTEAQLSAVGPHAGRTCLQLHAWQSDPKATLGMIESAPMWVTSAAVMLEAGQWVRIRGFVDLPTAIVGTVDGLLIIDSLGGPELAERVGQTRGWQEFTLYRQARQAGPLTVTFALTGLGRARIDDIAIEPLPPTSAAPRPADRLGLRRLPPVR